MKKLIFRNFISDIASFFLIGAITLTLIVWVIQAVNYLDFVTEDGHGFKVYFLYTLLHLLQDLRESLLLSGRNSSLVMEEEFF